MITVNELVHTCWGARSNELARAEGQHAGQEADMVSQPTNHVASVRGHGRFSVLLHVNAEVLGLVDLVPSHYPGAQAGKSVKTFTDIPGILPFHAPWVSLADIPANGITEHVIQGLLLADTPRLFADDGAELTLEVHKL